jgi:uncharacterized protein YoxC
MGQASLALFLAILAVAWIACVVALVRIEEHTQKTVEAVQKMVDKLEGWPPIIIQDGYNLKFREPTDNRDDMILR